MKRKLFILASVLSLLLCIAIVALWVRSYYRWDGVYFVRIQTLADGQRHEASPAISTSPSVIYIGWHSWHAPATSPHQRRKLLDYDMQVQSGPLWASASWDSGFARSYIRWKFLRFAWWDTGRRPTHAVGGWQQDRALVVPDWLLVCVFLVLPLLCARSLRRARLLRRQRDRLCVRCGYDLRATPDRCPECGTVVQKPAEIPA